MIMSGVDLPTGCTSIGWAEVGIVWVGDMSKVSLYDGECTE